MLYGEGGLDFFDDGGGLDLAWGGSDVFVSRDAGEADELYGQTGNDYLCSNDTTDRLVGNDSYTFTSDRLWFETTVGDPCTGASAARSSGAHCGDLGQQWLTTWLCPLTGAPWAGFAPGMGQSVECNYDLTAAPSSCAPYF